MLMDRRSISAVSLTMLRIRKKKVRRVGFLMVVTA